MYKFGLGVLGIVLTLSLLFLIQPVTVEVRPTPTAVIYADSQLFSMAEQIAVEQKLLPQESSVLAPSLDPGGKITREIQCSWKNGIGRPTSNIQQAPLVCEMQVRIVGQVYTAEDGVTTASWNLVLAPASLGQTVKLVEGMKVKELTAVVNREKTKVKQFTFMASYSGGVVLPNSLKVNKP